MNVRMAGSTSYDSYIMQMNQFNDSVTRLKEMAKRLTPMTYPKVHFSEEQEILILKQRQVTIDGYEVMVCYSEADYEKYLLKSLQLQSAQQGPFLPFTVVCKLGRIFLGPNNLSYIEFFRNNRKVYCWTVKCRGDNVLPPGSKAKSSSYEGFKFAILHPGSVDLF